MPKKFIWLSLLIGGLLPLFYTIDSSFGLHYHKKYPEVFFIFTTFFMILMMILIRRQFKKWILQTKKENKNCQTKNYFFRHIV